MARGMTVQARALCIRRVLTNTYSTLNEYVGVKMSDVSTRWLDNR